MTSPSKSSVFFLLGAVLIFAAAAGTYALYRFANPPENRSATFQAGLKDRFFIRPEFMGYHQIATIPIPLDHARAIAVGREDRIYVGGDRSVHIFSSRGSFESVIHTGGQPACLVIGYDQHAAPGALYVGVGKSIEVFSSDGNPWAVWQALSDKSVLTSLAVSEDSIYAADAGERVVIQFNPQGKIVGKIGHVDPDRLMPGFFIPSAYFDIVVRPTGELFAVNPGALRIEEYSSDGALEGFWGEAGPAIESFFGCCNPAHLALLPDGRFVTSEKGIPRIKVYSALGEFECVVAGPNELDVRDTAAIDARSAKNAHVFDIATNSQSHILVLDPTARQVRVFHPKRKE